MSRFDRYLLRQMMVAFGFFSLVLIAVYWVNHAVILFDRLITNGHSALVFLEFSLLSLPNVIRLMLPLSAFAATIYVTNRLSTESELTVMQATGFSPWRLARPFFIFGCFALVLIALLTHYLVPSSLAHLRQREHEVSASVSARLLREGSFLHPSSGMAFYIREITTEGELKDVFLSDRQAPNAATTYTAEKAYLVREDDNTTMIMVNGLAQTLDYETQSLSTTIFQDLSYDMSALVDPNQVLQARISELSTGELIARAEKLKSKSGASRALLLEEIHDRFKQPLLGLAAALIGFAALMLGGYSRFGTGRQILFAIFLLVVLKMSESLVARPVRADAALWILNYAPVLIGFIFAFGLLLVASFSFGVLNLTHRKKVSQ